MAKEIDHKWGVYYFKFFLFILLIATVLIVGKFIEKNSKKGNILGIRMKQDKKVNDTPLVEQIKRETEKMGQDLTKQSEKMIDNILGAATKEIQKQASSSADAISDYVFQNTVGNLLKQIDKLPNRQKDQVKKEICK